MPTRSHRLIRWQGLLISLILAAALPAYSEPFNRQIRAPDEVDGLQLKQRGDELFRAAPDAAEQLGQLRDSQAHARWADFSWQFSGAVDTRKSLNDLAALGVTSTGDGGYRIDATAYPQWIPPSERIADMLQPEVLEIALQDLRHRGFRERDVATVRSYVSTHNLEVMTFNAHESLARTFESHVKARGLARQAISREDVESFRYQRRRGMFDTRRAWSIGLIDLLDKYRQRILVSYAFEHQYKVFVAPDDPVQIFRAHLEQMRSGAYVRGIEAEKERLRR